MELEKKMNRYLEAIKDPEYTELQQYRRNYIRSRCERINKRLTEIEFDLLAIDIDYDTKTELEKEQDDLIEEKTDLRMEWIDIEEAREKYESYKMMEAEYARRAADIKKKWGF